MNTKRYLVLAATLLFASNIIHAADAPEAQPRPAAEAKKKPAAPKPLTPEQRAMHLPFLPPDAPKLADDDLVHQTVDGTVVIEAEHYTVQQRDQIRRWYLNSAKHTPAAKPDGDPVNVDGAGGGAYMEALPDTFVVEAEAFFSQTNTEKRAWHITSAALTPNVGRDIDPPHFADAGGAAYIEVLPDTGNNPVGPRAGESISDIGGAMAVASYHVHFNNPGRYYIWVRALGTDGDDNTLHFGMDGQWPTNSVRMHHAGGGKWQWFCRHRQYKGKLYLDVTNTGPHVISLSMREDGCEVDRSILTTNEKFIAPTNSGPVAKLKSGVLPDFSAAKSSTTSGDAIVIEAESVSAEGWELATVKAGFSGTGYLRWTKSGQGRKAGEGVLSYSFRITTPGNYQFLWRTALPDPKNRPETPDPDADPVHVADASGGAYVEILPDTRASDKDKLISGENFSNEPGKMAVLHYKVHFNTPGRYYVWVRSYSTAAEDNGVHVGLDGQWPESGQRWQTVQKRQWAWDSKQRTQQVHVGEPFKLFLEVDKAGPHELMFSLREDGFEMDKFILARSKEFKPEGKGPAVKVKAGQIPATFPEVAEAAPAPKKFPAHWGEPPVVQTRDLRPLPGGYGMGSGTLAKWIQDNLDKDATADAKSLKMEAASFPLENSGYYLDKGKWLAINPAKNQTAKTAAPFPYASGHYHVTLQAVGESDGKSTYQVLVNDAAVGDFTCPLSTETFEEGSQFHTTWKNIALNQGDVVTVSSKIASEDGKEHSRARIARLIFEPADESTKAATAKVAALAKPAAAPAPAKPLPPLVQPRQPDGSGTVVISGELKQWHKVTLTLDGLFAHEQDNEPNPFTDCALTVTVTHESGAPKYTVPGYFAADGNAANTSAESGTKWRVHLSPDKPGQWTYAVSFVKGKHVAVSDAKGEAVKPLDGQTGVFTVAPTDKTGRDFRAKGRLQYAGKHHLQLAGSQTYFLKAGPDSPETLLAYTDFDNTSTHKPDKGPLKTWAPHVGDWKPDDPTWRGGKGKGLIGALNYLSEKGVNAFSFLTYNVSGDGDNVWPFVEREAKLHYDCSKLDQWGIVFDHATAKGLYLHFKMQEQEMDDNRLGMDRKNRVVPASLDGGKLGPERKLYCRELIARFGHALALNWNIGEENTQTSEEIRDMAKYLHDTDPYRHHIVLHTFPPQQDEVYRPLLGGKSLLTGVSMQTGWKQSHQRTLQWRSESAAAGRPWVVAHDEQGPASLGIPPDPGYKGHDGVAVDKNPKGPAGEGYVASNPYTMHDIRKTLLWGHFLAGGAGVEYYFGYQLPQNDLICEDFRSRDKSWDYCRIAIEFFRENRIPFWEMKNANALIGNEKNDNSKYCLAKPGELYLVYLPKGGKTELDLSAATGSFTVKWFNPRAGGALQDGSVKSVSGGGKAALGIPPTDASEDWLVAIRK